MQTEYSRIFRGSVGIHEAREIGNAFILDLVSIDFPWIVVVIPQQWNGGLEFVSHEYNIRLTTLPSMTTMSKRYTFCLNRTFFSSSLYRAVSVCNGVSEVRICKSKSWSFTRLTIKCAYLKLHYITSKFCKVGCKTLKSTAEKYVTSLFISPSLLINLFDSL